MTLKPCIEKLRCAHGVPPRGQFFLPRRTSLRTSQGCIPLHGDFANFFDPVVINIARFSAARARHLSIAQWVREALEMARRRRPESEVGKKLEVICAAAPLEFPTADIARMLVEIKKG